VSIYYTTKFITTFYLSSIEKAKLCELTNTHNGWVLYFIYTIAVLLILIAGVGSVFFTLP